MAKSLERLKARELRKQGMSVLSIARSLNVAKSSASQWTRDIILSLEQLENLRQQNIVGGEKGRILGALKQKNDRFKRIQKGVITGKNLFPSITSHDLLIAGVALYWAEGTKKSREVTFCNSDANLVQFMIKWLLVCFDIPIARLKCCVGINSIHREREEIVKLYWSRKTGIPLAQFTKTSFKKVHSEKIFDNHAEHYGTLTVRVTKPAQLYYNILGLIQALYTTKLRQGSSIGGAASS